MERCMSKCNCYPRLSFPKAWIVLERIYDRSSVRNLLFAKKELQRGICTLQGGTGEGAWGMWALAKLSSTDYKQVGEEVVKMSLATWKYLISQTVRGFHRYVLAQFVFFHVTCWIFTMKKGFSVFDCTNKLTELMLPISRFQPFFPLCFYPLQLVLSMAYFVKH